MKTEYMPLETFDESAVYKLVHSERLNELKKGDVVQLSDGDEVVIVHLYPPHKVGSEGKVSVADKRRKNVSLYYASVIGAHYEKMKPEGASND